MNDSEILGTVAGLFKPFPLKEQLFMLAKIGSHSHGTVLPPENFWASDDIDVFGVVIPPPKFEIGFDRFEHFVYKQDELDVVIYSLRKYMELLKKANPNMLGTLFLTDYLYRSSDHYVFLRNRKLFVSKVCAFTFIRYAASQMANMDSPKLYSGYMGAKRKAMVDKFGFDVKDAAHTIRILKMCIELLQFGHMHVNRAAACQECQKRWTPDAGMLIAIKTGLWSRNRVNEEYKHLQDQVRFWQQNACIGSDTDYDALERCCIEYTLKRWGEIQTER